MNRTRLAHNDTTPQACLHAETSQAIMRLAPSPTTVFVVASAAISRRFAAPRLIFPDELPVSEPLDEGSFDGPNPSGATGFWTVYDDLATEDNLGKASRGEPTTSFLSTSMILRADGQTSRGSDFIKGRWELEKQDGRRRLLMTLRAPLLREELRYEGLLLRLSTDGEPLPSEDAADDQRLDNELRAVGRCSRWDIGADAPRLIKNSTFSMIKIQVRRSGRPLPPSLAKNPVMRVSLSASPPLTAGGPHAAHTVDQAVFAAARPRGGAAAAGDGARVRRRRCGRPAQAA